MSAERGFDDFAAAWERGEQPDPAAAIAAAAQAERGPLGGMIAAYLAAQPAHGRLGRGGRRARAADPAQRAAACLGRAAPGAAATHGDDPGGARRASSPRRSDIREATDQVEEHVHGLETGAARPAAACVRRSWRRSRGSWTVPESLLEAGRRMVPPSAPNPAAMRAFRREAPPRSAWPSRHELRRKRPRETPRSTTSSPAPMDEIEAARGALAPLHRRLRRDRSAGGRGGAGREPVPPARAPWRRPVPDRGRAPGDAALGRAPAGDGGRSGCAATSPSRGGASRSRTRSATTCSTPTERRCCAGRRTSRQADGAERASEREANRFAAELLMPEPLVRDACRPRRPRRDRARRTLRRLRRRYGLSAGDARLPEGVPVDLQAEVRRWRGRVRTRAPAADISSAHPPRRPPCRWHFRPARRARDPPGDHGRPALPAREPGRGVHHARGRAAARPSHRRDERAGSVPELVVENPLDEHVLLYDGEELIGAKQNRILNLTVLVAAGSRTPIPVSCVEAGRWHRRSASFAAASHTAGPEIRMRKAVALGTNALARGGAQADVWDAIAEQVRPPRRATRRPAPTPDMFEQREGALRELREAFPARPGQCGDDPRPSRRAGLPRLPVAARRVRRATTASCSTATCWTRSSSSTGRRRKRRAPTCWWRPCRRRGCAAASAGARRRPADQGRRA